MRNGIKILTNVMVSGVLTGGPDGKSWLRAEIDVKRDDEPTGCGKDEGGTENVFGSIKMSSCPCQTQGKVGIT